MTKTNPDYVPFTPIQRAGILNFLEDELSRKESKLELHQPSQKWLGPPELWTEIRLLRRLVEKAKDL